MFRVRFFADSITVAFLSFTSFVNADVLINFREVGSDLVGSVTGSANLSDLVRTGISGGPDSSIVHGSEFFGFEAGNAPSQTLFEGTPFEQVTDNEVDTYTLGVGSGPARPLGNISFSRLSADLNTAPNENLGFAGIFANATLTPVLSLPRGYSSGETLDGASTWLNTSFVDIGVTDGQAFTWSWGNGVNADRLTLNFGTSSVPEPSSLLVLGIGMTTLIIRRRRATSGT